MNGAQTAYYYTGDSVRRGGNLYVCIVDIDEASAGVAPTSSTDYEGADDSTVASDWESVIETQNWRGTWSYPNTYPINDVVIYFGDIACVQNPCCVRQLQIIWR